MTAAAGPLAGRIAVVSGAGRGLGQYVALGLASEGARVAVVARTSAQVDETVSRIRAAGGKALGITADVADVDAVERLSRRVEDELGTTDILINAAGIFGPIQLIQDSDPRRWIETLAINTIGPYLLCRAFVGPMIAAGWGRIVNFSSAASLHQPGPLNSAYGTSKVALNHFTRHLAAELAGTGVTANVIHPGEVKTAMWAAIRDQSETLGAAGEGYRNWAATVGDTGGDPPHKALELVLDILRGKQQDANGKFLWIRDGMQTPLPSW